jgi:hypothetical protein
VCLAFDCWTNPHHLSTFAISYITPFGEEFLAAFKQGWSWLPNSETDELHARQTSAVLVEKLEIVLAKCSALGLRVIGSVADNGSNVQKANRSIPGVSLNCHAHTGNLLLQDLVTCFETQFTQAASMEWFLRLRTFARVAYDAELARHAQGEFSHLIQANETRWGSKVDLLQSVCKNRTVIEAAVTVLRANPDFDWT